VLPRFQLFFDFSVSLFKDPAFPPLVSVEVSLEATDEDGISDGGRPSSGD
jgi:hypothetical protein